MLSAPVEGEEAVMLSAQAVEGEEAVMLSAPVEGEEDVMLSAPDLEGILLSSPVEQNLLLQYSSPILPYTPLALQLAVLATNTVLICIPSAQI